jgi:hypothetical protein
MAYTNYALEIMRGDTRTLNVAVVDATGLAQNLTGWSLWFTAKAQTTDADPGVFQKTIGSGITVASPTTGTAVVTLAPADTSGLTGDATLFTDLQGKDGSAAIVTLASGTLTVRADATRAIV